MALDEYAHTKRVDIDLTGEKVQPWCQILK